MTAALSMTKAPAHAPRRKNPGDDTASQRFSKKKLEKTPAKTIAITNNIFNPARTSNPVRLGRIAPLIRPIDSTMRGSETMIKIKTLMPHIPHKKPPVRILRRELKYDRTVTRRICINAQTAARPTISEE